MARGAAHGGGEEVLFILYVFACALVVCIVPGDFMFCFGRRFDLNGLEIVGIVFLCLGAAITVSMTVFTFYMVYTPNNYSENDKVFVTQWTVGIAGGLLLLGLIPGLGCGLGLHSGI